MLARPRLMPRNSFLPLAVPSERVSGAPGSVVPAPGVPVLGVPSLALRVSRSLVASASRISSAAMSSCTSATRLAAAVRASTSSPVSERVSRADACASIIALTSARAFSRVSRKDSSLDISFPSYGIVVCLPWLSALPSRGLMAAEWTRRNVHGGLYGFGVLPVLRLRQYQLRALKRKELDLPGPFLGGIRLGGRFGDRGYRHLFAKFFGIDFVKFLEDLHQTFAVCLCQASGPEVAGHVKGGPEPCPSLSACALKEATGDGDRSLGAARVRHARDVVQLGDLVYVPLFDPVGRLAPFVAALGNLEPDRHLRDGPVFGGDVEVHGGRRSEVDRRVAVQAIGSVLELQRSGDRPGQHHAVVVVEEPAIEARLREQLGDGARFHITPELSVLVKHLVSLVVNNRHSVECRLVVDHLATCPQLERRGVGPHLASRLKVTAGAMRGTGGTGGGLLGNLAGAVAVRAVYLAGLDLAVAVARGADNRVVVS